jgi:hypothetical protein
MTKPFLLLLVIITVFTSCQSKRKKSGNDIDNGNKAIHDLLPVNADTLIAVRWHNGLLTTNDGGKSWKVIANDIHLKQITIDDNKVLWGLDSWVGIHESDYARLLMSKDAGNTWITTEFDTKKLFPIKIVSQPHEKLHILTFDNKIYELLGDDPVKDWSLIQSLHDMKNEPASVAHREYKLLENGSLLKWLNPIKWDTLLTLNEISIPFEILTKSDTLFIAAGGNDGYSAYFASITNDSIVKEYPLQGAQALGVRLDNRGRIWTFGDGGIFLRVSDSLRKVY